MRVHRQRSDRDVTAGLLVSFSLVMAATPTSLYWRLWFGVLLGGCFCTDLPVLLRGGLAETIAGFREASAAAHTFKAFANERQLVRVVVEGGCT